MWTNQSENIIETIRMIQEENLDIRTITMGISLLDCADSDIDRSCEKIYNKITTKAGSSRKGNRRGIWNSDHQSAYYGNTDFHACQCIGRKSC